MRIYKIRTDAVIFDRYFILAEDIEKAFKKAKSIFDTDTEIRDIELVGEIAESQR